MIETIKNEISMALMADPVPDENKQVKNLIFWLKKEKKQIILDQCHESWNIFESAKSKFPTQKN